MKKFSSALLICLLVGCSGPSEEKNNGEADTGGDDMAADMGGTEDTGGTPDMGEPPPDMGGMPDVPVQVTCEPFPAAAEYVDADETGAFYWADDDVDAPMVSLSVEIYDEPPAVGSYALGENYETCLQCVLLYSGCDDTGCDSILLARSGTLEITAVGVEGERFAATLTNVEFEEVNIDEGTFISTPVAGGDVKCIDSHAFDVFIGTTCTAVDEVCEAGRPVEDPAFECVDDGSGTGLGTCQPVPMLNLPELCMDTTFAGQIGDAGEHGGGAYTDVAYANDAGLQAVWDAIPVGMDAVTDLSAAPLAVSGAIVTATSFGANGNSHFWVQDANAALMVRLTDDMGTATPVGVDVKVGQAVSFMVTTVETFGGHPQIKAITGFAVDGEGNDVYVMEKFDSDITAADYGKIVRVGGTLGAPNACGGANMCYPMTFGTAADKMVTLRSSSNFLAENDCAVFVGPVSGFPGPKDAGGITTIQVDTVNFDWLRTP